MSEYRLTSVTSAGASTRGCLLSYVTQNDGIRWNAKIYGIVKNRITPRSWEKTAFELHLFQGCSNVLPQFPYTALYTPIQHRGKRVNCRWVSMHFVWLLQKEGGKRTEDRSAVAPWDVGCSVLGDAATAEWQHPLCTLFLTETRALRRIFWTKSAQRHAAGVIGSEAPPLHRLVFPSNKNSSTLEEWWCCDQRTGSPI